jgi:Ankyrin repeats (3 copies)/Ankyrin repeat
MIYNPEEIQDGVPTIVNLKNGNKLVEWNIVTEEKFDENVLLNLSKKLSVNGITACCFKTDVNKMVCRCEFSGTLRHEIYLVTSLRNLLFIEKELGNLVSIEDRPRKYWKIRFIIIEHEKGFNLDKTALMIAIENQNFEKVAKLIGKSSLEEINTETPFGNVALLYSIHSGNFDSVPNLLQEIGFSIDKTTLMNEIENQITEELDKLIKKSSLKELNTKTPFGNTALHYAIKSQNIELVKKLLEAGANINVFGEISPLQYASSNPKILKQLISYKTEIDFLNKYDETALMFAASSGNSETVSLLLDYGADKNLKDVFGEIALVKAKKNQHFEVVKILK